MCESRLGASFNQHLTIGAHDGLRFVATSSLLVRRNITSTGAEIAFGALRAELNVPIAPTLRIFFGGGGGQPGWALGEIGVHWFVIESGGPGTVVLSLSAGGAGIFDGPYPITQFGGPGGMTGPTAGFGMEWRQ